MGTRLSGKLGSGMSVDAKLVIFFSANRRILGDFCRPVIILLAASALIVLTDADLFISGIFHDPQHGWLLADDNPWQFTYHYGMIPAFMMALGGLGIFLFGFFYKNIRHYRKIGIFLILFLLVGPGMVVNTLFKDHWGRPRPADIENFGGAASYQPFWQPGEPGQGKSFPSGHASVGFFIFAPFFFLRHNQRRLANLFLALGIAYGLLMGTGRIVQGGHFLSDVIWSGGFTYLSGLTLSYLLKLGGKGANRP